MSTVSLPWRVLVYFAAETPTDDIEADAMADRLTEAIEDAIEATVNGVFAGSVRVADLDTVSEAEFSGTA